MLQSGAGAAAPLSGNFRLLRGRAPFWIHFDDRPIRGHSVMNALQLTASLSLAAMTAGLASAQTPDSCVESFFTGGNGGAVGWTVMFDVDTSEPCTVHALRSAVDDTVGNTVDIEVWTASTSFGNELDVTQWTLAATATGTAAGMDVPTEFVLSAPIDLPLGTSGIALVHTNADPSYTTGNGTNEVHTSADGVLTVTANASVGGAFTGSLFQTRVWNGNLCYDVMNANCVTSTFADNNGGAVGGTVYFDIDAARPLTFSGITTHYGGTPGDACGVEVYTRPGTHTGFTGDMTGWTLVATDDGTATTNGLGVPTPINFAAPFTVGTGSWGVALVSVGTNHEYTNGGGANELQGSPSGDLTMSFGSATNGAFNDPTPFNPRVWNGTLCYDAADQCVETLFAANNGGAFGGAVYFDVLSTQNVSISGLTTNTAEQGNLFEVEVWTKNGTFAGFEDMPGAWSLAATGLSNMAAGGLNNQTGVDLLTPINLTPGRTGFAIIMIGAVGHDYTNGSGADVFTSADGVLTIEAGTASNAAFTSPIFNPRIWNGTLCYDGDFIGANFCEAVPNSTGATGVMSAVGSTSVVANNVQLRATNLPNNATAFFLTSQTNTVVMAPGTSVGNLCIAGPAIGRYVGAGQVQNSGGNGAVSLNIDLGMHPTPTGLISVLPGEFWNFQCWHRDSLGGSATSNFTDALRILFN